MTDDPQSAAFRDADEHDWQQHSLLEHPDGTLDDLDPEPHKTRDDYEAEAWDAERAGPKTLDEAKENLRARIGDPACPDTEAEAGAYDDEPADTFADERDT